MSKARTRSKKLSPTSPPDVQLFITTIVLVIFGVMAVLSAGSPEGAEVFGNPAYYVFKQLIFIIIGFFSMFYLAKYDYRKLQGYAAPVGFLAIILLAATLLPGLGQTDYGSSRWLSLGPIKFQPSEFVKPACVLLLSAALVRSRKLTDSNLLFALMLVGIMLVTVLKQPNLSMAMMLIFITSSLLFVAGTSRTLIFGTIGAIVPFIAFYISANPYQLNRLTGWLNPWADPQVTGYNLIQSWYAIGSGGLFGVGYGFSKQKYFWLPFRHTDFIFSIIAEELGFIGCLILISLFIIIIYRGFKIARNCDDYFGKLLAFGISFTIGIQAFINIAVATGVMPVTGMTLPLISYGGTSVVVTLSMIGVLLNISKKRVTKIPPQRSNYAA